MLGVLKLISAETGAGLRSYVIAHTFGLLLPTIPPVRRTSKLSESQKVRPAQKGNSASVECDQISVCCFLHPPLAALKGPGKKQSYREPNPSGQKNYSWKDSPANFEDKAKFMLFIVF